MVGQILRVTVTDRDGAVRVGIVLHHERGHWLSDDVAPPDNHAVHPRRFHARFP